MFHEKLEDKKPNIMTTIYFIFEKGFQVSKVHFIYYCLHLILTIIPGKHYYILYTE